jgi:hypothetical protein
MDNVTCTFTDVAISGKRNGIKKEAEKILKYGPYNRSTAQEGCKKQK